MPTPHRAFTSSYPQLSNVLINEVGISIGFDPHSNPTALPCHKFKAVWDTGATNTVISENVIKACNLQPTGMIRVHGVHGAQLRNTYLVNVVLPNAVQFYHVKVTEGAIAGSDVLIGMDIIGAGDFVVTNYNGKTVFSYRHPSIKRIDFVKDITSAGKKKVRVKKHRH